MPSQIKSGGGTWTISLLRKEIMLGVGSEYSKQVYYIRSPPTACELRSRPSPHYRNQKRPKGLFDFYGGGTWTRTKDTACIRRML